MLALRLAPAAPAGGMPICRDSLPLMGRPKRLPTGVTMMAGRYYGRLKKPDGRWTMRALGTDRRVAVAKYAELTERYRRAREGVEDLHARSTPLIDVTTRYLEDLRRRASESHYGEVRRSLACLFALAEMRIVADLSYQRAMVLRARLLNGGRSHRQVNKLLGYLKALAGHLVASGVIPDHPLLGVKPLPQEGRHRRRVRARLLPEEGRALIEASRGTPIDPLLEIVLGTGFRLGEALALRWCDFDAVAATLTVRAEKSKTTLARTNPLPRALAGHLRALHEAKEPKPKARITPKLAPTYASRLLRKCLDRANVAYLRPDGTRVDWHALRHTYCTWLIEAGASVPAVQALMGHADPRITLRIYADLNRAPRAEAVALLPDMGDDR